MIVKYNFNKLKKIINDFCNVTGISMAITDTERNFIYSNENKNSGYCLAIHKTDCGAEKCLCSDMNLLKKCASEQSPVSHICHAGLIDSAIPIFKNDNIAGYVIIGRIRQQKMNYTEISHIYNIPVSECKKLYCELPYYSEEQIKSICNLVSHMLFENAIELVLSPITDMAVTYIKENYSSKISVMDLCNKLHISKNTLYNEFHTALGYTVNEYITHQRINEAKKLLTNTDHPIYIISSKVGIDNITYFCKLFKKTTGFTPAEFRKQQKQ